MSAKPYLSQSYKPKLAILPERRTTDRRRAKVATVYTVEETGCQEATVWMDGAMDEETVVVRIPSNITMENGDRGTSGEWVYVRKPGLRGGTDIVTGRAPKGKWQMESANDNGAAGGGVATHWIPYTINDLVEDEPAPLYFPSGGTLVWAYAGCRVAATDAIAVVVKVSGTTVVTATIAAGKKRGPRVQVGGDGDFAASDHVKVVCTNPADAGAPVTVVVGYNLGAEPGGEED